MVSLAAVLLIVLTYLPPTVQSPVACATKCNTVACATKSNTLKITGFSYSLRLWPHPQCTQEQRNVALASDAACRIMPENRRDASETRLDPPNFPLSLGFNLSTMGVTRNPP